jgi:hypothetical protein
MGRRAVASFLAWGIAAAALALLSSCSYDVDSVAPPCSVTQPCANGLVCTIDGRCAAPSQALDGGVTPDAASDHAQ